ncbi:MAG: glycosyltransferase family 4 protein [Myxococcota bacterium]
MGSQSSRGPKLLALVTEALGGEGGIAQYNRDLLGALSQDWSVAALVRLSAHSADKEAYHQYGPIPSRLHYSLRAIELAVRFRPSVVFNGHIYLTPLSLLVARLVGAKLVTQFHGTEVWQNPGWLRNATASHSDRVLAVSNHSLEQAEAWIKFKETAVLGNTFRSMFEPGDRGAARLRYAPESRYVVLTVGRLDSRGGYKGHDRVIEALSKWSEPNWLYLVAGKGPDRPRLEDIARRARVHDKVRFLGYVEDAELPSLYQAADLFALPSSGEGFGIVYLEAMACGTDAIGLKIGGATSVLAESRLGLASEPEEFEQDMLRRLELARSRTPTERSAYALEVKSMFGRQAFANRAREVFSGLV